ncbi:MAG: bifunctional phosphopantothenoylcysteine decarboxylase/phosphopantothenate--cysteine ligase CoaBC [Methylococcales bacterium]|nr:bifunctional phosphopantothenoylcysteine decarboxylase/phosphopantothenate--cysteine ligase CoaBC [Methylococcales bacterium]
MTQHNILLAIGGGIAAYKCCELTRLLRQQDHAVKVIMTEAATRFITPLTLQALSGQPVGHDLFADEQSHGMGHIKLARWADVLVVAPATCDLLAKFSHGLADDLVSTLYLACQAPVILAPAMNQAMWQHPATQANIERLKSYGAALVGPESGEQACGEQGAGRMAEPTNLAAAIQRQLLPKPLAGQRVMITAGPTREPLDPVRFISNLSSGKMGYALAQAALDYGAQVDLVSGPVAITPPPGIQLWPAQTAQDMLQHVTTLAPQCDLFIAAAAVADYTPAHRASQKIKKHATELNLTLTKTVDIVAHVAQMPTRRPFTVGFAAETEHLEDYALNKLNSKKLDMIIANHVGGRHGGFERDDNAATVYWHHGQRHFELQSKQLLAYQLLTLITEHHARHST